MSKRDEVQEQIVNILSQSHGICSCEDIADKILALPSLAYVNREAELPSPSKIRSGYFTGYIEAQQDMLKNNWVKEVKDEKGNQSS